MTGRDKTMTKKHDQFKRSLKPRAKLGGFQNSAEAHKVLFPDLYKITVGHLFGSVWSRPHLSLCDRNLITIAVNMALERHTGNIGNFRSAKHIGVSKEEILELIMHVGMYAGWETMGGALRQYRQVLEDDAVAEKKKKK
jgi:4-carboxymuconolactone decarboxylase